ncbi:flagellin [Anaerosalibacter massiliensis]|uniref:Flagellin n=1 Tax=Anaerosalibacter massiliensis TaxID=1347392 RepID=A0A9X2MFW5_9FIRM|nr:flagellin [Anaerosalibacter massiliensis]MCR2044287.1 flagellin [Anaerosalibacter massiliensis]
MRINNNIPALNTHRIFNGNTNEMQKSLERLSSGKRINRAADDAAGMAISQKMQAQVRGLRQASRNSLDGVSLIQTAEGALNEVHAMLQRMRELSVQGANGTYAEDDLKAIGDEILQLTDQIEQIANDTEFNGKKLLNGKEKIKLQVGADEGQIIEIDMKDINSTISGLGINDFKEEIEEAIKATEEEKKLDSEKIGKGIEVFNKAVDKVAEMRSKLGAYQNRLEHTMKNIDNTAENLTASMSRIEDADMALEMSEFTRLNILQQAGIAMLAQANQLPQGVLQLLR